MSAIDMVGSTWGRITVIGEARTKKNNRLWWLCKCVCGNYCIKCGSEIRKGRVRSCGCLSDENRLFWSGESNKKHGMSKTRLYSCWADMISRCTNPKNKSFHNYGGRGISVCSQWRESAEIFLSWALNNGYKEGLQIDREDNEGNYTPDNCRFVTNQVNSSNKRNARAW